MAVSGDEAGVWRACPPARSDPGPHASSCPCFPCRSSPAVGAAIWDPPGCAWCQVRTAGLLWVAPSSSCPPHGGHTHCFPQGLLLAGPALAPGEGACGTAVVLAAGREGGGPLPSLTRTDEARQPSVDQFIIVRQHKGASRLHLQAVLLAWNPVLALQLCHVEIFGAQPSLVGSLQGGSDTLSADAPQEETLP